MFIRSDFRSICWKSFIKSLVGNLIGSVYFWKEKWLILKRNCRKKPNQQVKFAVFFSRFFVPNWGFRVFFYQRFLVSIFPHINQSYDSKNCEIESSLYTNRYVIDSFHKSICVGKQRNLFWKHLIRNTRCENGWNHQQFTNIIEIFANSFNFGTSLKLMAISSPHSFLVFFIRISITFCGQIDGNFSTVLVFFIRISITFYWHIVMLCAFFFFRLLRREAIVHIEHCATFTALSHITIIKVLHVLSGKLS